MSTIDDIRARIEARNTEHVNRYRLREDIEDLELLLAEVDMLRTMFDVLMREYIEPAISLHREAMGIDRRES